MKIQLLLFIMALILLAPVICAAEDVLIEFVDDSPTGVSLSPDPIATPRAAPTGDIDASSGDGDIEVMLLPQIEGALPRAMSDKRILIYNSHTHEAYEPTSENPYKALSKWRTKDESANMVAVGAYLTELLRAQGHTVTHDRTDYEQNDLSNAYVRSLKGIEKRTNAGEIYDLYLDIHRDAYSESAVGNVISVGGERLARLMCLVGTGKGQTGAGFAVKPDFDKNNALAVRLTRILNNQTDNLCRSVCVKSGRFNQHVGKLCLLIEVGNNKNTLEEALLSLPYLADALTEALAEY